MLTKRRPSSLVLLLFLGKTSNHILVRIEPLVRDSVDARNFTTGQLRIFRGRYALDEGTIGQVRDGLLDDHLLLYRHGKFLKFRHACTTASAGKTRRIDGTGRKGRIGTVDKTFLLVIILLLASASTEPRHVLRREFET